MGAEGETPRKGDLGWGALAGGRLVDVAEFGDPRPYFGLQREAGYLWGVLRDADGRPLAFMRRLADPDVEPSAGAPHALGPQLILQTAWDDAHDLHLRKEARRAASGDTLTRALDDGHVTWRTADGDDLLVLGADDAHWRESDLVDVTGNRVGPGLHWYLPGRDDAIYYPTQTWAVTGDALGRPVFGFLFYEEAYVPPGGRLYVHHDPLLGRQLHTTWFSWATEWDDDSLEIGHFLFGHDRFAIAVIGDRDGNVRTTEHMECEVTRSADGYWADRIDYVLDGEAWEMVPEPWGRMLDLGRPPNPQQLGIMQRVGEQRRPVNWMAWGESVPTHGERRVVRSSLVATAGAQ
ncbi:MAG: hypothetical protein WD271_06080 [Acidimicrobiia bacterium]